MEPKFMLTICLFSVITALFFLSGTAHTYENTYNVSMVIGYSGSYSWNIYADNQSSSGKYTESNITQYYGCMETTEGGNMTTGLVFMGRKFNFIELDEADSSNFNITMEQSLSGNRFIIPVSGPDCNVVDAKLNVSPGYMNGPFNPFLEDGPYKFFMMIEYPGVDFVSDEVGGLFGGGSGILLRKNQTGNLTQIIVEER